MLNRLMNVIKAMLNKGMQQMETPEVLAEEAQDQLEKQVKELLQAVTQAIANEKMLEQQIKKNNEDLASWEKRATLAVQQNNDDIAKQCLMKKRELNEQAQILTKQLEDQKTTTAALRSRHAEFESKLKEFMVKKDGMTQRAKAGDAMDKASEIMSNSAGTSGMGKYEQKIMEREAKAAALGELSRTPAEDKLKALGENAQVEDDLAALKAQMGQVKLVVDKESGGAAASGASGKTQVDANVPMVPDDDDDNLPMVTDVEVKDDDEKKGKK